MSVANVSYTYPPITQEEYSGAVLLDYKDALIVAVDNYIYCKQEYLRTWQEIKASGVARTPAQVECTRILINNMRAYRRDVEVAVNDLIDAAIAHDTD